MRWWCAGWLVVAVAALTLTVGAPAAAALRQAPPTAPPTTVGPLNAKIPPPVSTVPLLTKSQNAHVDPLFAYLSGVGFFVALVLMGTQYVLTRPGRRGRTL